MRFGLRLLLAMLVIIGGWSRGGQARELRGEAPHIDNAHQLIVPDNLWRAIVREFPRCRLPAAADYLAGGRNSEAYYIYSFADTALPYACWGDFNGDEWWDVVTYMIPEAPDAPQGVKLVVFHGFAEGFTPQVLRDSIARPDFVRFTLNTIPPGKIRTIKRKGYEAKYSQALPDTIVTAWDSFQYGKFGSAAEVYYWNDGRYQAVPVAD